MAIVINDFVMNLDHEYYPAIGEFMFRCGQLENQLHNILWAVMDLKPKQGRVLTIGAPISAVRGMIFTAVSTEMRGYWIPDKNTSLIGRITNVAGKSSDFTDLRNQIAHGVWQYPIDGKASNARLLATHNKDEKYFAKTKPEITAARIHKECSKVKSLNLSAKGLLIDLFEFRGWNTRHLHSRKNVS